MHINIPTTKNDKLAQVLKKVRTHPSLTQLYQCVNINSVDRLGMPDHGPVHIRIVTNIALKLLRLLNQSEVKTNIESDYAMTYQDAEVIVFLASLLHDIGISIHRDHHEQFSITLAAPLIDELLNGIYEPKDVVTLRSEILHAIIAHHGETKCLTIEAGVVKVADALDMTEGRSRISFEAGEVNIFSVSTMAIEKIDILKGQEKPVRIEIQMKNSAGIFQIDELLKRKLNHSSIKQYVEISAVIEEGQEKKIVSSYTL
ncbi:MAG TPA: HD domain-containing protein [bacterium]|nr:HD domain-containing protein [bacterium]